MKNVKIEFLNICCLKIFLIVLNEKEIVLHTDAIWIYGIDILKKSFILAYQTTRTFVTIAVPRFPWSLDKFHTPFATLTISSFGKTFNFLSSVRIELLNFRSRYIFEVEYALNMKSTMILSKKLLYSNLLVQLQSSNKF